MTKHYPKYDRYQRGLASMVYKSSDKKSASIAESETFPTRDNSASGGAIKNENISNKELAEELNQPIIRKFKKKIVHSNFIDNNWGASNK